MPKAPVELNRFHANMQKASQTMNDNVRVLRGWAKSKGWEKLPNPSGKPEQWGIYKPNGQFQWHLKIKSEGSLRPELDLGSSIPRFDARLNVGGKGSSYVNPMTAQVGSEDIGTHIPLNVEYW